MGIIEWFKDDVSWAITMVALIVIVYMINCRTYDVAIITGGITGIVALARGNGKAK